MNNSKIYVYNNFDYKYIYRDDDYGSFRKAIFIHIKKDTENCKSCKEENNES